MKKRVLSALLAVLLLPSCGAPAANPGTDSAADTTAAESVETTLPEAEEETEPPTEMEKRASVKANLPDVKFDGAEFRISTKSGTLYEINAEELNGEARNDAVFERNRLVEEQYDVTIVPVISNLNDVSGHAAEVMRSIQAQDDAYALIAAYAMASGTLAVKNMLQNWLDMKYNDFSQPWWISGINDRLTVKGKNYTAVGDMCVSTLMFTYGMFYNRTKGEDYGLTETIYDTVRDGKWTFDYFNGLVQEVYEDLNGDGKKDDTDFYGFAAEQSTNLDMYNFAFDIPITSTNSEGNLELTIYSEKTVDVIEAIQKLYWQNVGTYIPANPSDYGVPIRMFRDGNALFTTTYMSQAFGQLRDMEDDYSILPYPKWDENQEKYMTGAMDNYSVLCIPVTTAETDMVSVLVEALNVESYKTVFPTYFEQSLQQKYARDPESIEMINLLMDGRNFDFSVILTNNIQGLSTMIRTVVNMKTTNFATYYAKSGPAMEKTLSKLLKSYGEITG